MKRVRYFDLLRVVCFCMIIFYHMMIQLYISGMFAAEYVNPYFSNSNMHLATLAVAVFFMLSGASLMVSSTSASKSSTGSKETFNLKRYYLKRFIRILIPFYIVNIFYAIYRMLVAKTFWIFDKDVAPWKIILGVFGIDEWLSLYNVSSFSQGIGEWFLGALIIIYVFFPLFRKLMLKNRFIFFGIVAVIYFLLIFFYPSQTRIYQNILVKTCEFILGMYLGMYCGRLGRKWLIITLPIVAAFFFGKSNFTLNQALSITVLATAFFVSFSFLEKPLQKSKYVYKAIGFLSGCSYELFLVHHVIIYAMTPALKPYIHSNWGVLILFIAELLVMGIVTAIVKVVCDKAVTHAKTHCGHVRSEN